MSIRIALYLTLNLLAINAYGSAGSNASVPWPLLTAQIVNFSLFILVLIFLLRKPASDFFKNFRADFLEESSKAQKVVAAAEKQKKEIEERLQKLETTYTTKLEASKKEAKSLKESLVKDTENRANKLIMDTQESANILFKTAEISIKNKVLEMAVDSSTTELTKRMDVKESERLHGEFLEEISAGLS